MDSELSTTIFLETSMMIVYLFVFSVIAFYSLRLARIKKTDLIMFLPKEKEFEKEIKYLILSSLFACVWITSVLIGYAIYGIYLSPLIALIEALSGAFSIVFLTIVFVKWGRRVKK